jgi:hypothetical protein
MDRRVWNKRARVQCSSRHQQKEVMAKRKKASGKSSRGGAKKRKTTRASYSPAEGNLVFKLAGSVSTAEIARRVSRLGQKREPQSIRNFASSNSLSLRVKPKVRGKGQRSKQVR